MHSRATREHVQNLRIQINQKWFTLYFYLKNLFEGFGWHNVEDSSAVSAGRGADWLEPVTECSPRCVWNQTEVRGTLS